VFEAQTDGVSADCCDGETSTGGPFNWCSQCGPYDNGTGACGQYAPGGTIGNEGWDTIACPNATYNYQRVSPATHEFDGTCSAIAPSVTPNNPCAKVSAANSGVYCGKSNQNGFAGGSPTTLYDCENGWVASTKTCPDGCFIAPAGKADGCNASPPDAGAPADGGALPHDASAPHPDAASGSGSDASPVAQDDAGSGGGPSGPGNQGDQGEADGGANGASPGGASGESGGCSAGAGESPAASAWLVATAAVLASRRRRRARAGFSPAR